MSDLAGLLERVRKADGPDRELDRQIAEAVGYSVEAHNDYWIMRVSDGQWDRVWPLTDSIDSALALVEAKRVALEQTAEWSERILNRAIPQTWNNWLKFGHPWFSRLPLAIIAELLSALQQGEGK